MMDCDVMDYVISSFQNDEGGFIKMNPKKRAVFGMIAVVVLMLFAPVLSTAGNLDPSSAPASTMKTLDEVYSTKSWSKVLTCATTTNCPRFEVLADFNDNAVLDKETGLVWEQSPGRVTYPWLTAMDMCQRRKVDNRRGWRLPTVEELASLVDPSTTSPSLPIGHPFSFVMNDFWTSTAIADDSTTVYLVTFSDGTVGPDIKIHSHYVWCVRGGRGSDGQ